MKILALALGLLAAQDFDKAKHPWAKWKVESSVKFKMTIEAGGNSFDGEFRSVLTGLKEKEYTLRHVSSLMGAEQEEEETDSFGEKKGEETLKVDGKEHACAVWASAGKRGEKAVSTRLWLSGASECPLKMTWKAGEGEGGEFSATKLGEKLSAGGKEFDAVLLEGEMVTNELGTVKGKLWMHPSVPGGVVRMQVGNDDTKITLELVGFEAKR